jgi:hypothetical protein
MQIDSDPKVSSPGPDLEDVAAKPAVAVRRQPAAARANLPLSPETQPVAVGCASMGM